MAIPPTNTSPYDLAALGPSWVTDYNESWHVLDTPTVGFSEAAQAVATGDLWSEPPSPQELTEIASASQTEFALRPVAGTYQLDLTVGPGVNLSVIQNVQIYTDMTFWVVQAE